MCDAWKRREQGERERGHECNRRFMRERSASLWRCVGRGECEGGSERERRERERDAGALLAKL